MIRQLVKNRKKRKKKNRYERKKGKVTRKTVQGGSR